VFSYQVQAQAGLGGGSDKWLLGSLPIFLQLTTMQVIST